MTSSPPDRDGLLRGIREGAAQEVGRIEEEAKRHREGRLTAAQRERAELLANASDRCATQTAQIEHTSAARFRIDTRRVALRTREEVLATVLQRAQQRLAAMVGTPAYRPLLVGWIAEGAIGLDERSATVSVSEAESALLDRELLAAAEREVVTAGAQAVRLEVGDHPCRSQGVVLHSLPGSSRQVAFSNELVARLERRRADIRRLVQERLFGAHTQR